MVATAVYSLSMVLWKETAFPLCRAMDRRGKRNVVSLVSSVIVVIRLPISIVWAHMPSHTMYLFCSLAVFNLKLVTLWRYFLRLFCTFSLILIDSSTGVLSTSWCCPFRPCVVFLACVHLALFPASSRYPGILFPHSVTIVGLCQLPCFDGV